MDKEPKDNLLIEEKIEQAFKSLHHEIDFASKVLNVKSSDFANTLHDAISSLKLSLSELENINKQINDQNTAMINELTTFALLPEKITYSIKNIVPQIACEVEKIHNNRILEIQDRFISLHHQLTKDISDYEHKLEYLSNQSLNNLSAAIEKFSMTIEQKLAQFSNQLVEEADAVLSQKSMRFLKNLAFILLFSGLVSAFASYLVATQFPRYVRVDAPNNLSIIDSKVQVWEAKSLNTKEPQFDKQKKSGKIIMSKTVEKISMITLKSESTMPMIILLIKSTRQLL